MIRVEDMDIKKLHYTLCKCEKGKCESCSLFDLSAC